MKKTWVSAFGFIILMLTAVVWAAPVPDTGQSKCYNNTVEIPCPSPGQPFYGQDANYSINPMSYTKLDSSGNTLPDSAADWSIVKDNVTGLIWEAKTNDGTIHDMNNTYTWYDPTDSDPGYSYGGMHTKYFIDVLNITHFGGNSDWRIPAIKEIASIINYDIIALEGAISTNYFPNTQESFYWSSSTYVSITNFAWSVYFPYGYATRSHKSFYNYVRAVRGGQSGGYKDNGDGTVTDTSTGLMWQQAGPSNVKTWEQALAYCEGLNLGGYKDWRLPSKRALRSLVDFSRANPSINTTYFPDTVSSFYWTSTTNVNNVEFAWGSNFSDSGDGFDKKLSYDYVRAVRGGQAPTPTRCTATIDENLLLNVPYLSYINPFLGKISLWADFVYEFNPTYPTLMLFKLKDSSIINNFYYLCAASTLSDDSKIHIPDVRLPDGSTHLWVDLEFAPALSTDESAYFLVTSYGVISN